MAYPKGLEQHHLTLSKDVSASTCWTNHSSSVRGETIILWSEQRASFPEHWDQHKWRPLDALSPEDLGKTQRFSDWDEMNSEVSTGWLRSLCWKSCLLISLDNFIYLAICSAFQSVFRFFCFSVEFQSGEGRPMLSPPFLLLPLCLVIFLGWPGFLFLFYSPWDLGKAKLHIWCQWHILGTAPGWCDDHLQLPPAILAILINYNYLLRALTHLPEKLD